MTKFKVGNIVRLKNWRSLLSDDMDFSELFKSYIKRYATSQLVIHDIKVADGEDDEYYVESLDTNERCTANYFVDQELELAAMDWDS